MVYTQSRDAAQAVASELQHTGVRAEAMACDVANPPQVGQLVSRVLDTFGRLDILVNDAAYNKWIPFNDLEALTYEEWQDPRREPHGTHVVVSKLWRPSCSVRVPGAS